MIAFELAVALVIAAGLVGVLVPLMPGSVLVVGAVLLWAVVIDEPAGWLVLAIATGLVLTGSVIKYLVPGRRLQRSGVPTSTMLAGAAVGVVGFFVVPFIGLPLGFLLGIYLAESHRLSTAEAWPATVAAVKAVGLGILIELSFSVLAAATWGVGVVVT
jgi:uncharacterized protein YqgC (DUF456 family)